MNQASEYLRSQKILHWTVAVLLLFWLFVSGELVEEAEGSDKATVAMFHASGALIILGLMIWRFVLRLRRPVAAASALSSREASLARFVHLAFYLLVALMVLSGLLQGLFLETELRLFGLLDIARLDNPQLFDLFHGLHGLTANVLKVLIAVHVLAALKHQFLDGVPIFRRLF